MPCLRACGSISAISSCDAHTVGVQPRGSKFTVTQVAARAVGFLLPQRRSVAAIPGGAQTTQVGDSVRSRDLLPLARLFELRAESLGCLSALCADRVTSWRWRSGTIHRSGARTDSDSFRRQGELCLRFNVLLFFKCFRRVSPNRIWTFDMPIPSLFANAREVR